MQLQQARAPPVPRPRTIAQPNITLMQQENARLQDQLEKEQRARETCEKLHTDSLNKQEKLKAEVERKSALDAGKVRSLEERCSQQETENRALRRQVTELTCEREALNARLEREKRQEPSLLKSPRGAQYVVEKRLNDALFDLEMAEKKNTVSN